METPSTKSSHSSIVNLNVWLLGLLLRYPRVLLMLVTIYYDSPPVMKLHFMFFLHSASIWFSPTGCWFISPMMIFTNLWVDCSCGWKMAAFSFSESLVGKTAVNKINFQIQCYFTDFNVMTDAQVLRLEVGFDYLKTTWQNPFSTLASKPTKQAHRSKKIVSVVIKKLENFIRPNAT